MLTASTLLSIVSDSTELAEVRSNDIMSERRMIPSPNCFYSHPICFIPAATSSVPSDSGSRNFHESVISWSYR